MQRIIRFGITEQIKHGFSFSKQLRSGQTKAIEWNMASVVARSPIREVEM